MTGELPPGFLVALRIGIVKCFVDMNGLRILCADLGINFENISGDTPEIKALQLINHLQYRGRKLESLLEYCKSECNTYPWPDMISPPTSHDLIKFFKPTGQGPIVPSNQGIAWSWLGKGRHYIEDHGLRQTYAKAINWVHTAANQRSANLQNALAYFYDAKQDYTQAVEYYQKAAEQGLAEAQYNLGDCYAEGFGVNQDYTKAVEWYQKAAEQGLAEAQFNLGYCYARGLGVNQDYVKALEWYLKAADRGPAEQGHAGAEYNLGVCYAEGLGLDQDYAQAIKWYQRAADQGYAEAQYNLGDCYAKGLGVNQDYAQAVEWYSKAAEQGNAKAQFVVGTCYAEGLGVKQDDALAVEWYQKAAEGGDAGAQFTLGSCYSAGLGVTKDDALAEEWYQKAAEGGDARAQLTLANLIKYRSMIRKLFSEDAQERIDASGGLMKIRNSWSKDPKVVHELVDFANNNRDNSNGIYNAVIVLKEFSKDALEEANKKREVLGFLEYASTKGSKTAAQAMAVKKKLRE